MIKFPYPCHHCQDRHEGCHAVCEKYQAADKANKEEREARFRRSNTEGEVTHFLKENAEKRARRHGRK